MNKTINVTLNFDATPQILQLISDGIRFAPEDYDEKQALQKRINELEEALAIKNLSRENDFTVAIHAKNEKILELEQRVTELQQIVAQLTGEIHDLKEINNSL